MEHTQRSSRHLTLVASDRVGRPVLLPAVALAIALAAAVLFTAALPFVGAAVAANAASDVPFVVALLAAAAAGVALRQFVSTLVVATRSGVLIDGHAHAWADIEQVRVIDVDEHGHALMFAAADGTWAVTRPAEPGQLEHALGVVRGEAAIDTPPQQLRRHALAAQWVPAMAAVTAIVAATVWQTSL